MITAQQKRQLADAIHAVPELFGVQIGYYGDQTCSVLDPGTMVAANYGRYAVIVEETAGTPTAPATQEVTTPAPAFISNRSRTGRELLGAGLSCTFAVISGVGVLGSAAAEVPSGGTSTFLLVAAWAGFATSSVQCMNGIVRSVAAISDPDSNSLQQWDSNTIYTVSMNIVDFIGVASGLAALPQASRNLIAVLERRGGLLTSEMLANTNRMERARLIQEAVRRASQNPESRQVLEQALREAGALGQATQGSGASVRIAERVVTIVTQETTRRLYRAVFDVIGGAGAPVVSSMPSSWVGSASGSWNTIGGLVLDVLPLS